MSTVLAGRSADYGDVLQPGHGFRSHPGLRFHPNVGALRRLLAGSLSGLFPSNLPRPPAAHRRRQQNPRATVALCPAVHGDEEKERMRRSDGVFNQGKCDFGLILVVSARIGEPVWSVCVLAVSPFPWCCVFESPLGRFATSLGLRSAFFLFGDNHSL